MKLFLIQDADRPVYVVATDWTSALKRWKKRMAQENGDLVFDVAEPQGIQMICQNDHADYPELLIDDPLTMVGAPLVPMAEPLEDSPVSCCVGTLGCLGCIHDTDISVDLKTMKCSKCGSTCPNLDDGQPL